MKPFWLMMGKVDLLLDDGKGETLQVDAGKRRILLVNAELSWMGQICKV